MSLSEAPSIKITCDTAQDISDEILGGVIKFCRQTGYKQNMMMLTFFWSAFLLSAKKTLDENGILNDTINCFNRSLGKVFSEVLEDLELRENVNNMRQYYWNQLSADFDSLCTETEILPFIKIADEINIQGDNATTNQLEMDSIKIFLQVSSNINSNIYHILHDINNAFHIQYKHALDEFRYARVYQEPKINTAEKPKNVSADIPPVATNANEKPLGMAWYKFIVYFSLIFGAIINIIYSFNYIFGGVYFVETNGEASAEQVYAYYGAELQVVDIFYGLYLIAFAIFAFVVRHKLANYEPDSLKYIKIFYSFSVVSNLLYAIIVSVITGESLAAQALGSAIGGLIFLFLNIKYFKKRAHLFVGKTVSVQPSLEVQSHPHQVNNNNEVFVTAKAVVSEQQRVMFCCKCGEKIIDNSNFCHKCGEKIEV